MKTLTVFTRAGHEDLLLSVNQRLGQGFLQLCLTDLKQLIITGGIAWKLQAGVLEQGQHLFKQLCKLDIIKLCEAYSWVTKPKKKKQDNLKDAVVWLSSSEYLQDIGSSGASLVGFPLHPIKKKNPSWNLLKYAHQIHSNYTMGQKFGIIKISFNIFWMHSFDRKYRKTAILWNIII